MPEQCIKSIKKARKHGYVDACLCCISFQCFKECRGTESAVDIFNFYQMPTVGLVYIKYFHCLVVPKVVSDDAAVL
jgi:hypothetical protein